MITAIPFLVLVLACWRLSCLLAYEDGPACCFLRARTWAVTRWPEPGQLGELVTCPYCLSVWFGALLALLYWVAPGPALLLSLPLALSGGACVFQRLSEALEAPEEEEGPLV